MNNEKIMDKIGSALFRRLVIASQDIYRAKAFMENAKAVNDPGNDEYWSYALRGAEDRFDEVKDIIDILAKEF